MEYLSIFAFWYEMIFYSPLRTLYLGVRGSAHIWCPFVAIWLYTDITLPLGIILMITNDHLMQLWSVFPVLVLCQTLTVQPAVFFLWEVWIFKNLTNYSGGATSRGITSIFYITSRYQGAPLQLGAPGNCLVCLTGCLRITYFHFMKLWSRKSYFRPSTAGLVWVHEWEVWVWLQFHCTFMGRGLEKHKLQGYRWPGTQQQDPISD